MSCERFEDERIDVAAGAAPSPALAAHLQVCPACRARIEEQRRRLDEVDRVLKTGLGAEPSPDLTARVHVRLRETADRRAWRPVWVAALAAAVAAALLTGWMVRRPRGALTAGPRQAATLPEARPREGVTRVMPTGESSRPGVPAVTRRRVAIAGAAPRAPRRVAATGAAEPPVLVPPGQEEALRRFVASLGGGVRPAPPLLAAGASVDGAVEPPALLQIPTMTIEPLPDPAVSPERSQR
jgi:hypothetical protein